MDSRGFLIAPILGTIQNAPVLGANEKTNDHYPYSY